MIVGSQSSGLCSYQEYKPSLEVKVIKRHNDKLMRTGSTGHVECMSKKKICGNLVGVVEGKRPAGTT